MAKLSDIANEVGVSNKTVSLVLRGQKCASAETTRQIFAVAEQVGYVPNQAARMMRLQKTPFIGLLADMVATTPYTVELIRGAQAEALAYDRHLLIGSLDGDPGAAEDFWQMFRSHRAKGVIYATMYRRKMSGSVLDKAAHVVMANCSTGSGTDDAVLPDDVGGGYLQADHLLRLGHRRVGVITLSADVAASRLRNEGILQAFADHHADLAGVQWAFGIDGHPHDETYTAFEHAMRMLSGPGRPTAIICGNDRIAMLVYCAAASLGLRIPGDVSVIGFDDFRTVSQGLRPELTTIDLPYFEMGRKAVNMILEGRNDGCGATIVPCRLIERQSCGPPPETSVASN